MKTSCPSYGIIITPPSILWIGVVATLLGQVGCTTSPQVRSFSERNPPAAESLGVVGIAVADSQPPFGLEVPLAKKEAVLEIASKASLSPVHEGVGDGMGVITWCLYAPVGFAMGSVVGVCQGVSGGALARAERNVTNAMASCPLPQAVATAVKEAFVSRWARPIRVLDSPVVCHDAQAGRGARNGSLRAGAPGNPWRRYRELDIPETGKQVDTLLVIRLLNQGLTSRRDEAINPRLSVTLTAAVDLVRARDGVCIHTIYVEYEGERHRFTKWSARDAQLLRSELRRAVNAVALRTVEGIDGADEFPGGNHQPVPIPLAAPAGVAW